MTPLELITWALSIAGVLLITIVLALILVTAIRQLRNPKPPTATRTTTILKGDKK